MKSFKHYLFLFIFICIEGTYIVISTAQTDLGLRFGTFSLKINNLPTFSEITQAWQCFKLCLYGQMSSHTEFQLQIMFLTIDIDFISLKYKAVYYTRKNHSTMIT